MGHLPHYNKTMTTVEDPDNKRSDIFKDFNQAVLCGKYISQQNLNMLSRYMDIPIRNFKTKIESFELSLDVIKLQELRKVWFRTRTVMYKKQQSKNPYFVAIESPILDYFKIYVSSVLL